MVPLSAFAEAAPYVVMLVPLAYAEYTRRGAKKARDDAKEAKDGQDRLNNLEVLYGSAYDRVQQANDLVIHNLQREIERLQKDVDALHSEADKERSENAELRRRIGSMEQTIARMRALLVDAGITPSTEGGS